MIQLKSIETLRTKISTLAIPVCEDDEIHDDRLTSLVASAKKLKEFKGEKDETVTLYDTLEIGAERVMFFGIGKREQLTLEDLRSFAGKAVKTCVKKNLADVTLGVPSARKLDMEIEHVLEAILEGACLGNHIFDKYKKDKKQKPLRNIVLLSSGAAVKKFSRLPKKIAAICDGVILARNWVSTPSNDKTPAKLGKTIIDLAAKAKLKTTILNSQQLKQRKFGAILAVGAGSKHAPRMVVLEYVPKNAKKTLALVGKGVTFDSGGVNLKPTSGLEGMKGDMAGAAAVAATLITAAKLKPKMKIIGVIPLVENMVSGSAIRPGDIIKSHSGKTIEIGNTDAEGRLILADAMSYTQKKYKPDIMIDIATLTGACLMALGEKIAGLFTPDDDLAEAITASGLKTHERTWRLPMPEDYKEMLKSDLADISNLSNSRWGGAITAALFLKDFTGDVSWAHLDIAGPAFQKKGNAYCEAGGTGFGVRLFCDLIQRLQ